MSSTRTNTTAAGILVLQGGEDASAGTKAQSTARRKTPADPRPEDRHVRLGLPRLAAGMLDAALIKQQKLLLEHHVHFVGGINVD
jgi:hypothetical protein